MSVKLILYRIALNFPLVFLCVILAAVIGGSIYGIQVDLTSQILLLLFISAIALSLLGFFFYFKDEMSKWLLIIRHCVQLLGILIVATVGTYIGFRVSIIGYVVVWSFAVIAFVLVMALNLFYSQRMVNLMNVKLQERYGSKDEERE